MNTRPGQQKSVRRRILEILRVFVVLVPLGALAALLVISARSGSSGGGASPTPVSAVQPTPRLSDATPLSTAPPLTPAPVPAGATASAGVRLASPRHTIAGFASVASAAAGNRVSLFVTTPAALFYGEVYRLGWYKEGAELATLIDRLPPMTGIVQPPPSVDPETGLVSAANWQSNGSFVVASWPTGLYLLKLISQDGDESYIPLVVRDDTGHHDVLFEHGATTDQAYNAWGGKSLYDFNSTGAPTLRGDRAAIKVSFDRPFDGDGAGGNFLWELNMVRWLEANHFDVGYVSDLDVHRDPHFADRAKAVVLAGHSEYWSKEMRDNLEAARNQGKGLGFFTGDTGAWAIRFEDSPLGPNRVEVGYKEVRDPQAAVDPAHSTGHWRDAPLNRPTQAFIGVGTGANIQHSADWVVRGVAALPQLFAGTELQDGDVISNLVGYEYDGLWTPGASQSPPDGAEVLGSARVTPKVPPDALLGFWVERAIPSAQQPMLGTLTTTVETQADKPYWRLYVHLSGAVSGRRAYLMYRIDNDVPSRRMMGDDEVGGLALGWDYAVAGWHPISRDLRADYTTVFGEPPPADLRVDAVMPRGTLSVGSIEVAPPGGAVAELGLPTASTPRDSGWQVQSGIGQLGQKLGPAGEPALTMEVQVPGDRRPDDADTVFIPAGSQGALVAVGSIQWSWGLDDASLSGTHVDSTGRSTGVDSRLQALTANLISQLLGSDSRP